MTRPGRILVIDDDPAMCEAVRGVLRLEHHQVEAAARGREGLDLLAARPFDVAVVDVRLPDILGLGLLAAIKSARPETEVILITGHASLPTAIDAVNGGAFGYLEKPVEDNPHDVELTLRAFSRHNLSNRIHVARDGAEALDFLFATGPYAARGLTAPPRVILLDLKLPKVDGIEVLRRVKADPRVKTIPVVVLTSSREERDVIESYALGVNSYIVKPVDFGQFTEAVRHLGLYWLLLNHPPVQ